jgi:hypothetical protein
VSYYPDGLTEPLIDVLLAEVAAFSEEARPTSRLLARDTQARHERRIVAERMGALVRVLPHVAHGSDLNEVA